MSHNEEDKLADPTKVGPGTWFSMHRMAIKAKTPEKKQAFIEFINDICDNFKCLKCRGHCQAYIKTNPPSEFMNIKDEKTGEDIGMFKWSTVFHNAVNVRLGKPVMDYATAYSLYADADFGVCAKDCDKTEKPSLDEMSRKSGGLVKVKTAPVFSMVTFNNK